MLAFVHGANALSIIYHSLFVVACCCWHFNHIFIAVMQQVLMLVKKDVSGKRSTEVLGSVAYVTLNRPRLGFKRAISSWDLSG